MVNIHIDKRKGRIFGQKVARTTEEAIEILHKDLAKPSLEQFECPICKQRFFGEDRIVRHVYHEHPRNRKIFEINPLAYQEWVVQ